MNLRRNIVATCQRIAITYGAKTLVNNEKVRGNNATHKPGCLCICSLACWQDGPQLSRDVVGRMEVPDKQTKSWIEERKKLSVFFVKAIFGPNVFI